MGNGEWRMESRELGKKVCVWECCFFTDMASHWGKKNRKKGKEKEWKGKKKKKKNRKDNS